MKHLTLYISFLSILRSGYAEARTIASNNGRHVQMIELYSSESCSSCPPADKYFSALKGRTGLWEKFVPVAFQVDYWNNLGWKDELSSPRMTERQKDVAATWVTPAVYTPALVVDGREWRSWSGGDIPETLSKNTTKITINENAPGDFSVSVKDLPAVGSYTLHFAKLGMGIQSNVISGENSGLHMQHDFVVLDWDKKSLPAKESTSQFHFADSRKKAEKYAVVAWIEKNGIATPIQATGGYL